MESLAQFLGVHDPRMADPGPAPAAPDLEISARDFCRGILASAEYRQSVIDRIHLGTIPPAIEAMWYHYAHGKPVEHVEVSDPTAIENLTPALAIQKLERVQRMLQLLHRAQLDEDDSGFASIH